MRRLVIILCFIPRVIFGRYTAVQRQTYSEQVSRHSRSNLPTLQDGYVYKQFDKPGVFSSIGQPTVNPYLWNNHHESKSLERMTNKSPMAYGDVIMPYTTPSTLESEIDYALARSAADARYETSKITSDSRLDKLKSLMHYQPPPEMMNENMSVYDVSSEYHMDDDDIRSSSRSLYDNWPYFYHSPYEYEHNKDISDSVGAKDKRYASNGLESIIPVHEVIHNDRPEVYGMTPKYDRDVTDKPIRGDEPFYSFVLNDYSEKSGDEDPLTFRGLDWGSDINHNTFLPELEENSRNRRLGNSYYSTISPITVNHDAYTKLLQAESATDRNSRREHVFDKGENGRKKNSEFNTGFENQGNQYNGYRDFLDSFANKFGSEDLKKKLNYVHATNQDKGENKKGFRRVYHKDEYQEDKEFYDNNNSSTKGLEEVGAHAHVGGSEAYLRSQAAAAVGNQANAINNSGITNDAKFENTHNGHDKSNTLENNSNKYRDVAKQAAQSNNADYTDHYRIRAGNI